MITRRHLITRSATLAALYPLSRLNDLLGEEARKKFHIGACDWSLGKSSNIEAFDLAKKVGLDGIMVNMGFERNNMHLRQKPIQEAYINASRKTGIKISSLAIAELNNIPYKSDPRTIEWVWDSIEVASNLGVPVVMLAFFNKNNLKDDEEGMKEVIKRLKEVAPHAEKKGIIIGIESYLDAAGHLRIMEEVGSKNLKAYVDFRNVADAGYDVLKEVRLLGRNNICELHMKENGALLGQGTLPWEKIRDLLYEMNYIGDGWMQIESSLPKNSDVVESYKHNLSFLKTLFKKKV